MFEGKTGRSIWGKGSWTSSILPSDWDCSVEEGGNIKYSEQVADCFTKRVGPCEGLAICNKIGMLDIFSRGSVEYWAGLYSVC